MQQTIKNIVLKFFHDFKNSFSGVSLEFSWIGKICPRVFQQLMFFFCIAEFHGKFHEEMSIEQCLKIFESSDVLKLKKKSIPNFISRKDVDEAQILYPQTSNSFLDFFLYGSTWLFPFFLRSFRRSWKIFREFIFGLYFYFNSIENFIMFA